MNIDLSSVVSALSADFTPNFASGPNPAEGLSSLRDMDHEASPRSIKVGNIIGPTHELRGWLRRKNDKLVHPRVHHEDSYPS
jgi:hypothetical protein